MPTVLQIVRIGVPLVGAILVLGSRPARAQMSMSGGGRSLGGYGASTISSYYGGGGGGFIPYNGNASGFIPYHGLSGGGMGLRPIPRRLPQTPIGGVSMAETPIGGASLSGDRGRSRGGMGMGRPPGRGALVPFGYEGGVGMGGGMATPITRRGEMRPSSGPGFGWPFRMPPSLTGGSGMAMP